MANRGLHLRGSITFDRIIRGEGQAIVRGVGTHTGPSSLHACKSRQFFVFRKRGFLLWESVYSPRIVAEAKKKAASLS